MYHRPRTNTKKYLSGSSKDTYVYSVEDDTDPMYESLFAFTENDSISYLPTNYDSSTVSNDTQRSSELTVDSFSSSFKNIDDQTSNKIFLKKYPSQTPNISSEPSTEPSNFFQFTNGPSASTENDLVSDSTPCTYHKRSFSCSDISAFRNTDWTSVESERISVSRSMPSICTDNNFQYISKTSNSFSTYDFAFATVHTTEETENNFNKLR